MKMQSIYVAGPDVFRADAAEYFNQIKDVGKIYHFDIITPYDPTLDELPDDIKHVVIGTANFELIDKADIVVANLMMFRGCCVDDGTSVEVGYGFGKGKIICGYTSDLRSYKKKVEASPIHSGEAQDMFPVVEDFGLPVNLMFAHAIKTSGGIIAPSFEDVVKVLYWKRLLK